MTWVPKPEDTPVDVQQWIKVLSLPRGLTEKVNPYVRPGYGELWDGLRATGKEYVRTWRNKVFTTGATSLEEMITTLDGAVEELRRMRAHDVVLDPDG